MLEIDIRKVELGAKNSIRSHHVSLDSGIDLFILLSVDDEKLEDLLFHKIVDSCIDRIQSKTVYKDFSLALENVNSFLDTWNAKDDEKSGCHAIVSVSDDKNLYFSTIGKASCYLYNGAGEIIEITDKKDNFKDFNYISNGEILSGESIIFSSMRLLDVLSADDMKDGFSFGHIKRAGENIEHVLYYEQIEENVGLLLLKKSNYEQEENSYFIEKTKYYFFRTFDNNIVKNALSYSYHIRDEIMRKSKETRQYIFATGILVSACILYLLISQFFQITGDTKKIEEAKVTLTQIQEEINQAGANLKQSEVFDTHITEAKNLLQTLQEKNLFQADIQKMTDNIELLEKQFNGVEMYDVNPANILHTFSSEKDIVKVLQIASKTYIIHKKSITGPILPNVEIQEYSFSDLKEDDIFVDATEFEGNILLITKLGRVVRFTKNNFFSYVNVLAQDTWIQSPIIRSYGQNLYMLSQDKKQILRYTKQGDAFQAGVEYLNTEDTKAQSEIFSLGIDGGIYVLNTSGEIYKVFKTPKYRYEKIKMTRTPKNYLFNSLEASQRPDIYARADLKYVYMLYKNKILIFQPNTFFYQDVSSLNYVGQIEGQGLPIQNFYVPDDGNIIAADTKKVFKIQFEILEGDLILR